VDELTIKPYQARKHDMTRKRFTVVVDWTDGCYEDSHDFVVYAESGSAAKKKAKDRWCATVGQSINDGRVQRVWVLTPALLQKF
jgi:hypothetical protein